MSSYPEEPPAAWHGMREAPAYDDTEKGFSDGKRGSAEIVPTPEYDVLERSGHELHKDLQSRHMQMIAIGGAIGAGLFVGSGSAFEHGGPASVFLCFVIIGVMMYFVMQALAELGVMYPVNGAFFSYACRFISPAWGFAMGWDYAIQWLTVLPFEITAATLTLEYWAASRNLDHAVWVTVFLFVLFVIQVFGVRGYGEVEFILSIIKIIACTGFIILGIVINTGGVPTDNRGYIGGRYWTGVSEPSPYIAPDQRQNHAFKGGIHGFCSVFVTAAFAFSGTELTGLAAAEAANPLQSLPKASKQVLWRITFFYVVLLLLVGLCISSNDKRLLNASSSNTKDSPFVIAIKNANIPILPGIFNAVITISVISVANACTFGSTRTIQALAAHNMAPKFLAYVDKHGRPIWCIVLQFIFGLLAYTEDASGNGPTNFFNWLLALSGVGNLFVWGAIMVSHIRFRKAWAYHGRHIDELPFRASGGVWGSAVGIFLSVIALIATFYVAVHDAVYAGSGSQGAYVWWQEFIAAPLIAFLYFAYKLYSKEWYWLTPLSGIDLNYGVRGNLEELQAVAAEQRKERSAKNLPKRIFHALF